MCAEVETHTVLQVCTETSVMREDFQCRLHAGALGALSRGAEVSVQHRLETQISPTHTLLPVEDNYADE